MIQTVSPVRSVYLPDFIPVNNVNPALSPTENNFYRVKPGDSIEAIALKVYGDSLQFNRILEANKFLQNKNFDLLKPGLNIFIPPASDLVETQDDTQPNTIDTTDRYISSETAQLLMKKGFVPVDSVFLNITATAAKGNVSYSKASDNVVNFESRTRGNELGLISQSKVNSTTTVSNISFDKLKENFETFGKFSAGFINIALATRYEINSAIKQEKDNLKAGGKFSNGVVNAAEVSGKVIVAGADLTMQMGIGTLKGLHYLAIITGELTGINKSQALKNINKNLSSIVVEPFKQGYTKTA